MAGARWQRGHQHAVRPASIFARLPGLPSHPTASLEVDARPEPTWPVTRPATALVTAWAPIALLVLLAAGGVLFFIQTNGTSFAYDEWTWIFQRRGGGLGTFLNPHNNHLSLVPVAIYKLLFATAGLRHYWPYRAIVIGAHLACVALLFVYARARVGGYFALLAAALMLFFGPGWQDFLWPFQVAWLIAIACGIGALLLLDRRDRFGDIGACTLLALSLASAGPGIAVAVGVTVDVLQRRRPRDLWIAALPISLYGLWWLAYQHPAPLTSPISTVPPFVLRAAAGALSGLAGLSNANPSTISPDFVRWGVPLLVVGVIALVWRLVRLGYVSSRVLTLLAMALSFWIITGVGRARLSSGFIVITTTGDESRYLYVSAVLILLLLIEAARAEPAPARAFPTTTGLVAGCLVVAAVISNLGLLRAGAWFERTQGQVDRTELGTLDITRSIVQPDFVSSGFIYGIVKAGDYFAAERALGSPAASPAQIAAMPEAVRMDADSQLMQIERVALRPAGTVTHGAGVPPTVDRVESGALATKGACATYRNRTSGPAAASAIELTVPATGLLLTTDHGSAAVGVRRFAAEFRSVGSVGAARRAILRIPSDLAPQPWHVRIVPTASVTACRLS